MGEDEKGRFLNGREKIWGRNKHVPYLDSGDSFAGIHLYHAH